MAAISNERLQSLLTPVVEAAGADFEDVKIRKAGSPQRCGCDGRQGRRN